MNVIFIAFDINNGVGGMQRFNNMVFHSASSLQTSTIDRLGVVSLWDYLIPDNLGPNVTYIACGRNKFQFMVSYIRLLRSLKPEIVFIGHVMLSFLAIISTLMIASVRNMLFVHGTEVWGDNTFRKIPKIERAIVLKYIANIVSVSRFTAKKMERVYGIDTDKFIILPNAIHLGRNSINTEKPVEYFCQSPINLLTVSRLSIENSYKGCEQILHSLPIVLGHYPKTMYNLVGEGALIKKYERLANHLNIQENVKFWGYVSDSKLNELYDKSHIFILASKGEGFGIVYLEAWKHFLPVVGGSCDAASEVIDHNINGLVVNPDSVDDIAYAILGLISSPEKMKQMGLSGNQKLMEYFTRDRFIANFRGILLGREFY